MDFLFPKQLVVDCTKLIPSLRFADKQKPHSVTFCKVLNIIDRHAGHTYMIPCTGEINAAGVIDIVERHIKRTIGVHFSIVSHQDVVFMSAEFQHWLIKNGLRHIVSTTYHAETDGQTERQNKKLIEIFVAHQLQGTDCLTAAPKVQTQVNSRVSKSRGQSHCFTLYRFQPKVSSTE